jgi:hypothetical protein
MSSLIFPSSADGDRKYARRNSEPESAEKKNREIEVRDLKPKTDPKRGATDTNKVEERPSGQTGQADFMEGLK